MTLEYWFMFPVAILVATTAMASGIGGATFFAPIFILALGLPPEVAIGTGTSWKMVLGEDTSLRFAYQTFWLAEPDTDGWYNAWAVEIRRTGPGQRADSHVGREVDLTVRHRLSLSRVPASLEAGYSHFQAGAYVRDTGPSRDADFADLQTRFEY